VSTALFVAILALDFLVMWSLPLLFFENRDGRLNLSWFLTALPFAVAPTLVLLIHLGVLHPIPIAGELAFALRVAGAVVALASTGLVIWTWRTHRVRLSLWHMENDAPASIVTSGPYAFIRHPFYTSFLLGMLGALLHAPHVGLLATLVYAGIALTITAAREERRLSASAFGAEYVAYMKRTGRFLPRRHSGR
jgi:protein-S-isoprenylcysteine O-methyltransferase Ste14